MLKNPPDSTKRLEHGHCELCNRLTQLTFHHLIPKKLHRRKYFRKNHTKDELNTGIAICRLCHSGLHKLFDESLLGRELNSLHSLRANADVVKHVAWVARQKC